MDSLNRNQTKWRIRVFAMEGRRRLATRQFARLLVMAIIGFNIGCEQPSSTARYKDSKLVGNWLMNSDDSILTGISLIELRDDGTGQMKRWWRKGNSLDDPPIEHHELKWSLNDKKLQLEIHAWVSNETDSRLVQFSKALATGETYEILSCDVDRISFSNTKDVWLKVKDVDFESVSAIWEEFVHDRYPAIRFRD